MFCCIKKWILEKFWMNKPIMFDDRIYTIIGVYKDHILVDTPYFAKHIQNKDINKIKLLKINKDAMVGQKVYYYDQQNDEMKTGTITYIGQDGTMKLDNDNVSPSIFHIKYGFELAFSSSNSSFPLIDIGLSFK